MNVKVSLTLCFLGVVLFGAALGQLDVPTSEVKCGPGAADDQIEQLIDHTCDCCGCKDNPICRATIRSLVVNSLTIPFDAKYCNDPWEALFNKTSGKSVHGKKCPNPNYSKVTKHTACQIGMGCCDGKPLADEKLKKVQDCASSSAIDVMCKSCSSLSATDSVLMFHSYGFHQVV